MQSKSQRKQRPISVCVTCKRKKLKCDKIRPICSRCRDTGKICVYESNGYAGGTPDEVGSNVGDMSAIGISPASSAPTNTSSGIMSSYHNGSINTLSSNVTISTGGLQSASNEKLTPSTTDGGVPDLAYDSIKEQLDKSINLSDVTLDLWNPRDMIVKYGSTTYFDLPLGSHAIIQYDPFTRIFCASLHGNSIFDLQSRLNSISQEENVDSMLMSMDSKKEIGPIPFIEKAIVKWVERTNEYVKNQLPLDYFNTIYTIEDTMHPSLLRAIETLVREIEVILIDKREVDFLLRKFYEEIYPFFPLIEIPRFEKRLNNILMTKDGKRYSFDVYNQNIRIKLETLVLFLLILSISLRTPNLEEAEYGINRKDAEEISRQLSIFAQKLLSLLNGFKFTNENILCCSLYLYIAEYLNPETHAIYTSHNDILTLKCLSELSTTLGLFHDPACYTRYKNDPGVDESFFTFRRKLWMGLQALNLQSSTMDGGASKLNFEYMNSFMGSDSDMAPSITDRFNMSSSMDKNLFVIQEDKYNFHLMLNRLMTSFAPVVGNQVLSTVLDNISRVSDFMESKFSLSSLTNILNSATIHEPKWRNAAINLDSVRNIEVLNINLIGLTAKMNIYNSLAFYFERLTIRDWEKYQNHYHTFLLKGLECSLKISDIVVRYLSGDYAIYVAKAHEYCFNKQIVFTLIRLWTAQMSLAIRFAFKLQMRQTSSGSQVADFHHSGMKREEAIDSLLKKSLQHIQNHMKLLCDLTAKRFSEVYFGSYQATLMVRYLIYLIDTGSLASATTKYWDRVLNTNDIPERISEKVNSKWGIGPETKSFFNHYLKNTESLASITCGLMEKIEWTLKNASFYQKESLHSPRTTPGLNEQDMLNQFLESNFDFFQGVFDSNSLEFPRL